MRVAIVGSRNSKGMAMDEVAAKIPLDTTQIVSGGADGIDDLAEQVAKSRGISFHKILPDYESFGKSAPIVRNETIVRCADLVLAFWDFESRGTASVIACCISQHVPVEVIGLSEYQ